MLSTEVINTPLSNVFVSGASVGTWSKTLASNVVSFNKAAGINTGTIVFELETPVPKDPEHYRALGIQIDKIFINYNVGTVNLKSAPTIKLYKNDTSSAGNASVEISTTSQGSGLTVGNHQIILEPVYMAEGVFSPQTKFHTEMTFTTATAASTGTMKILSVDVAIKTLSDSRA